MLDSVGPKGLLSIMRPALAGRRYLKELPEAIKAHLARAGAAKPTGVEEREFRNSNFGFRNSQKKTDENCGLADFETRLLDSGFENPKSEIRKPKFFHTWPGYRKQEKRSRTRSSGLAV